MRYIRLTVSVASQKLFDLNLKVAKLTTFKLLTGSIAYRREHVKGTTVSKLFNIDSLFVLVKIVAWKKYQICELCIAPHNKHFIVILIRF